MATPLSMPAERAPAVGPVVSSRRGRATAFGSTTLAILLCVALAALLTADRARDVWQTGAFFDTDDAMRAVQLRAWLAGQAWYDLSVPRLDPPGGVFMHWSRVVDLPLAALALVAKPLLGADFGERFARLAFPALCLAGLFAATGWTASWLGGLRARLPAIVACFLGAPVLAQFVPGRIDHHAPQIVLLMTMTGALLASFDPRRASHGAVTGLCAALSLSISLENLPYIALVAAAAAVMFVMHGAGARTALLWFGTAFAASLVLMFLATVGPAHRFEAACDALSIAHVIAGVVGCATLVALAVFAHRLKTVRARLFAIGACAPLPLLVLRLTTPNCLGDPFVGLDPLVRDIWLHHVGEVEPLPSFLSASTWTAVSMVVPLLAGLGVTAFGVVRTRGILRARYAVVGAMLLMTLAMAFWGIRVLSSGLPLVGVAAAPWMLAVADRLGRTRASRIAASALAAVPVSPLVLVLLLPADNLSLEAGTLSCMTPDALAPLAALPQGTIVAPIDMGSHLLAFTPHAVVAAPYHRDNAGNRLSLDAFLATPEAARAILEKSGATYVAICGAGGQARVMAERAPAGLATQLLAGKAPNWLEPITLSSPQKVYRVSPSWALRTASGD